MTRYYYYAQERGCIKRDDSMDELGVGVDDGEKSCYVIIRLRRFPDKGDFTMEVGAHNDEWAVFARCSDVFKLLSERVIKSGGMASTEPFYALRFELEKLGYKNLGPLDR